MASARLSRLGSISGWILLAVLACCLAPATLHAQSSLSSAEQRVAEGDRHLAQGRTGEARKAYREAVKEDGSLTAAHLGLARVDLEEKQWDDAKERLHKIIKDAPDHIEAHYYRAIAYRELVKFRTFNQGRHRKGAEEDFRWVIERDSLFRDVFHQYALLRRYSDAYAEAIDLVHVQVALKPDLDEAQHELFRLYRSYLNHTDAAEAHAWLERKGGTHAAYFAGEALRRTGRLDEADARFRDLLSRPLSIPPQPVLLSRARIHYQKENPERAQRFVEQAIDQIESPLHAALAFDDFKYIVSEDELAFYRTLETPDELKTFLRAFWARRNPLPARPLNVRLAEHYRRLLIAEKDYVYDGFRLWFSDPDRRGDLTFPAAYVLNQEFNDKGLIYLRHGPPHDREGQVGGEMEFRTVIDNTDVYGAPSEYSYNAGWRPNESWRYNAPQQMDFHFVVDEGGGANNWRLTPALTNFGMLESREHWGPPYSEMARIVRTMETIQGSKETSSTATRSVARSLDEEISEQEQAAQDSLRAQGPNLTLVAEQSRSMLEFTAIRQRMVEQSIDAVQVALNTDQHTWEDESVLIPMPYVPAAFRGNDGQTRVEIYFALPLGTITSALDAPGNTVNVEMGYAVHDVAWRTVAADVQTKKVPTNTDPTAALIDFYQFSVPPDSYQVSLHGFTTRTGQVGGDKFAYRAPDFSQPTLAMSDLVLADFIGPAQVSRFDRGDLHISPNPFMRFSVQQPVFVYFELYRLGLDANDLTQFTVEYTLTPEKRRRRNRAALSIRTDRSTEDPSPVEYIEIDVRKVDPGDYTLTVTITDKITGETRQRSRPLALIKYK